MLGGSVYIAFIRFMINCMGVVLLFTQIGESRFDRKRQYCVMDVFVQFCLPWHVSGMWWTGQVMCG